MSRPHRNFRPFGIYHVVQRGNKGQWVFCDDDDFSFSLDLLKKKAPTYGVTVHAYCLTHNQGQWLLEPASKSGLSCLMRDMQCRMSKYLNRKYKDKPWRLFVPLETSDHEGRKWWNCQAVPLKGGVNWTPRFFATQLTPEELGPALTYLWQGPLHAGLIRQPDSYKWSWFRPSNRNPATRTDLSMVQAFRDDGPHSWKSFVIPIDPDLTNALRLASRSRLPLQSILARIKTNRSSEHLCRNETPAPARTDRTSGGSSLAGGP